MNFGIILDNIKAAVKSSIMCIRFPFLYPRNRFTGLHYNNWKIVKYHRDHWDEAFTCDDHYRPVVKNWWMCVKIKFLDWLNEWPLQIIHCVPTYTELDMMPSGWRDAFGIKMCKDIRRELRRFRFTRKYRIMDIKEKYGTLHWYDAGYPAGSRIPEIIDEYEKLSWQTCIICGRPAKRWTTGWLSPYCREHCPDRPYSEDPTLQDVDYL